MGIIRYRYLKGVCYMSKKSRTLLVVSLLTSSVLYPGADVLAADLTTDQQAVYDAVIAKLQLGEGSLAVGPGAEAYGKAGIAIGNTAISNTETLNESSIAIGDRAKAQSSGSIGMGVIAEASGRRSIAMGHHANAAGDYSMALGSYNNATGADSIAIGHNAVATKSSSGAIGSSSVADRGYDTYGYIADHTAFTSDIELLTYLG